MSEVQHNWTPSIRLQKLMVEKGDIPVAPVRPGKLAHVWLDQHRALFVKPGDAQRAITIIRCNYGDLPIDALREMVATSYVENKRVMGALQLTRNLGHKTFEALRDVLRVA